MSVYTEITREQLQQFLTSYPLGDLIQFTGIMDGIENTNYAISTTRGEFILTLFESFTAEELNPFIALMHHLSSQGIHCPVAQTSSTGMVNCLQHRPAAIFQRLAGRSITQPNAEHCYYLGQALAKLHVGTQCYRFTRSNPYNLDACKKLSRYLHSSLNSADYHLMQTEIAFQQQHACIDLPSGVIHADLFPDNVLFAENFNVGIIDFYSACQDILIMDIAICINAWCIPNGILCIERMRNLLSGYQRIRVLQTDELHHLPMTLRQAALRFWLSRLKHQCLPRAGTITQAKDPNVYRSILQQHQAILVDVRIAA